MGESLGTVDIQRHIAFKFRNFLLLKNYDGNIIEVTVPKMGFSYLNALILPT